MENERALKLAATVGDFARLYMEAEDPMHPEKRAGVILDAALDAAMTVIGLRDEVKPDDGKITIPISVGDGLKGEITLKPTTPTEK